MKYLILISIVTISVSWAYGKQLPSLIKKCNRTDQIEFNKCLLDRAIFLIPHLSTGIPELKLPSIEPFHIPKFELRKGSGQSFNFNAIFADVVAYGAKDAQVTKFEFDLDKKHVFIHIYIPDLKVKGFYNIDGKIVLLQLKAEGRGEINITDIHARTHMNISIITRNNKEYVDLGKDYKINREYGKISLYFADIFKDNQQLTEVVNRVLNDKAQELVEEIAPVLDESLYSLFLDVLKPLFDEFSIDEMTDK